MKLIPLYMNRIELQNKIFNEFKELNHIELTIKELNEVIEDYVKYCSEVKPIGTYQFVETYLDKF